jgi:hypothetical protein
LLFSLMINIFLFNKINDIYYFYPITISMYSLVNIFFLHNNFLTIILIWYAFFLLINMYIIMKDKYNFFNVCFYSMFSFEVLFISFILIRSMFK